LAAAAAADALRFFFFDGGGEGDLESSLFFRFSLSFEAVEASLPCPRSRDDDEARELPASAALRTVVVTVLSCFFSPPAPPPSAGEPGALLISSARRFLTPFKEEEAEACAASSSSLDRRFPFPFGTSSAFPLLVGGLALVPPAAAFSAAAEPFSLTRSSFLFSFLSVSFPFNIPPPPTRTTGFFSTSFSFSASFAASSGRRIDSGEVTLVPEERDVRPVPPVVFARRVEAFEEVEEVEEVEDWREGSCKGSAVIAGTGRAGVGAGNGGTAGDSTAGRGGEPAACGDGALELALLLPLRLREIEAGSAPLPIRKELVEGFTGTAESLDGGRGAEEEEV
jgi:hypothetical protein